ncbi:MAG: PQQ-binding-like beta-propeller repeat protein [Chloroflexota bacterium]|nr:PQQ-binding-like beta-propeller repeat protein [Chloroflexota bacterium]
MSMTGNLFRRRAPAKLLTLLVTLAVVGAIVVGCATPAQPRGWSGVAITDGDVYFGSMNGQMVGLHSAAGTQLWSPFTLEPIKSTGGFGCAPASTTVAIYGTPAAAGDLVYVAGYDGQVYAVNSSKGVLRWVYPRQRPTTPQPVVGGLVTALGKVFFGLDSGSVYSLDAETGDLEWQFPTGDKVWSTPTIDSGTLYIGSFDKKLYALNAADGTKKWEFPTGGAIVSTPTVANGIVYFGSFDRQFYAVNAAGGSLKWKSPAGAGRWFWAQSSVYKGVVYAPNLDGKLYLLDAGNGNEIGALDLGSSIASAPVLVGSSVIVATENGKIYTIDTATYEKRQLADIKQLANLDLLIYSPLSAADGVIYVHAQTKSKGSLVYALNAQTGAAIWRYPKQ